MTISINGTLVRPAEYRRTLEGDPAVIMIVSLGRGLPFEVRVLGPSFEVAQAVTKAARRGDALIVNAEGISHLRQDHDVQAVILTGIEQVWLRGSCVYDSAGLSMPEALR